MKKLSKVLSVICALVLVASLGVTAFAAFDDPIKTVPGSSENVDVMLKANEAPEKEEGYKVTITYDSLDFTYTPAGLGKWNTESLQWGEGPAAKWEGEATFSLSNSSSVKVAATPSFTAIGSEAGKVNATFNPAVVKLEEADNQSDMADDEIGAIQTGSTKLTLSGAPSNVSLFAESTKVGDVTIDLELDSST